MKGLLIKITSTFCGIGYLPAIPGTFASIAGVCLFLLVRDNPAVYITLTLCLTGLGFLASGEAEKCFAKKDPKYIVIDEVSGMLLALMSLPAYDFRVIIMAFVFFRILDTLKPFPAGRIQELKGSIGIMGDDIIAAIYTNIVLQAVLRLANLTVS